MDIVLLKPTRSDVLYQGQFAELIFETLANPAPLYRNLLKHLGKYGANLSSLRFDAAVLAEATLSCSLLQLNTFVQVRLDRLEVNFLKLHEVGEEAASQILLASWAALHETQASISIAQHVITINVNTVIQGTPYDRIIKEYVVVPQTLGENTGAGVAFYSPEQPGTGERWGSFVLDRLEGQKDGLALKVKVIFDAGQVPFSALRERANQYLNRQLQSLGLELIAESK